MRAHALALLAILALAASGAVHGADARATQHALLIGVNDYLADDLPEEQREGPVFPDLNGALNDVELMRSVLIDEYGFDPSNVTTLTDSRATRAAILGALGSLSERVRPGDVVYVHFSGHGSQVPDFDDDERDTLDETILPHDARTPGVKDVTDDELGALLSRMRGASVLVVLDSCHSGTATRGATLATRRVPPDTRLDLYRQQEPKTRQAVEADFGYVLMTGAAEQEAALDGPIGGRNYGFFSYMLARAMQRLPREATAWDVHQEVLAGFAQLGRRYRGIQMPEPQLEAPMEMMTRALLVSAPRPERPPRVPFAPVVGVQEDVVTLDASGFETGPGTLWAIYGEGELEFAPGEAAAVAEQVSESAARVVEPPGAAVAAGARAVPLVGVGDEFVLVHVAGLGGETRAAVLGAVERLKGVREVTDGELPHYVIVEESGRVEVRGAGGLRVLSAVPAERPRTAARHVYRVLKHARSAARVRSLENRNSSLRFDVALVTGGAPRDAGVAAGADAVYSIRGEGEPRGHGNSLQLTFRPETDGYLTIVDVDTDGKISVLFPNAFSEKRGFLPGGFVRGGSEVTIPDSLSRPNAAGFFWDIAPPAGLDTLQVFFASDERSAREIREFIGAMASDEAEEMSLRGLARTLATRGVKIVGDDSASPPAAAPAGHDARTTDWTSTTLSYLVEGETP